MAAVKTLKGQVSSEDVKEAQKKLGVTFSEPLNDYLREYGVLHADQISFFGLGVEDGHDLDMVANTLAVRAKSPSMPKDYVALSSKKDERHFILYSNSNNEVILWDSLKQCPKSVEGNDLKLYIARTLRDKNKQNVI